MDPITPPVSLPRLAKEEQLLAQDIQEARKLAADKTALYATVVHVAILLVAALYMKLPAKDVAVLGSIVAAGNGYFTMASGFLKMQAAARQ